MPRECGMPRAYGIPRGGVGNQSLFSHWSTHWSILKSEHKIRYHTPLPGKKTWDQGPGRKLGPGIGDTLSPCDKINRQPGTHVWDTSPLTRCLLGYIPCVQND